MLGGLQFGSRRRKGVLETVILNWCKYALVLPCAVVIAVKFGVHLIFVFNLSIIIGKNLFVVNAFVIEFH